MMDGYDDGLPDQGTAHECSDFHECKAAIAQAVKDEQEQCIQKLIAWKSFHIKRTIDTGGSGIMVSAIYDEAIKALKDRP